MYLSKQVCSPTKVPVFKAVDRCVFTNYRTASLLPQFSKIREKLYNARLENFLNMYNLLWPSQYAFIFNMSTFHAILELVEEITNCLYNNKYSIGVFIDLKKAFDTVYHDVLTKK